MSCTGIVLHLMPRDRGEASRRPVRVHLLVAIATACTNATSPYTPPTTGVDRSPPSDTGIRSQETGSAPSGDTAPLPMGYCALPPWGLISAMPPMSALDGGHEYCAKPTIVTTLDDVGPGSLRQALARDRYVVFHSKLKGGQLRLQADLVVSGLTNVTLDGRAIDGTPLGIRISDRAVKLDGADDVVISYVGFIGNDAEEGTDALTLRGNGVNPVRVLVAHNRFHNAADGALDVIWNRDQPAWITVAYNQFTCNNKTMLVGTNHADPAIEGPARYHLTLVENWFHKNLQRQPLVRNTNLHYIGNVITDQASGGKALTPDRESAVLAEDNGFVSGEGGDACRGEASTGRRFILIAGPDAQVTERDNLLIDGGVGEPYNEDIQGAGFATGALEPPYAYPRVPMTEKRLADVKTNAGY